MRDMNTDLTTQCVRGWVF